MKDRFSKLMSGNMNAEELKSFQNEIESMSDDELDKYLEECEPNIRFDSDDINELQAKLNDEINTNRRHLFIYRLVAGCAAVLLPLLVVSIIYLLDYRSELEEYHALISQQINIETSSGEFVTTILPDGSNVSMGPESDLSYSLGTFNTKGRRIQYSGEGNFKISHNGNAPFILSTSYFEIKVLGTEFSLISRDDKDQSEIYLDKGSIMLTSLISNDSKVLKPGEYAVISKNSGEIELLHDNDRRLSVDNNNIYFSSASFAEISKELERYYGYHINQGKGVGNLIFTGSIPTNDLRQAIYILENTLNLNFAVDSGDKAISVTQTASSH